MQRPLLATLTILLTLAILTACSDPTPDPETLAPTSTPAPTAITTPTEIPVPTESPAERSTAAPTATPASTPAPGPAATPAPPWVLAPLHALDSAATLSELSDAELACIGENPERQTRFFGCLNDETIDRIFLAGFVPGPEPLSQESSDCVRAAFEVIDPRAVMTAGIEGDPGRAMAGSMAALSVTVACLNDEEWEKAGPAAGMSDQDRAGGQCLMAELGGPGKMAEAMLAAQEGDITSLSVAGTECRLDMGSPPGQPPGTPPPAPIPATTASTPATTASTPATTASTPASTPVTPGISPTGTPATPTPSPTQVPSRATSTPTPTPTTTLTITVAEIPVGIPDYSRSEWKHWTDEDGDCQGARQEVLIAESLDQVTFETEKECRVATDRWWAPHLGHHLENPRHIDVDHHVPLKNAHLSGGWRWSPEKKEQYANDLGGNSHGHAGDVRTPAEV